MVVLLCWQEVAKSWSRPVGSLLPCLPRGRHAGCAQHCPVLAQPGHVLVLGKCECFWLGLLQEGWLGSPGWRAWGPGPGAGLCGLQLRPRVIHADVACAHMRRVRVSVGPARGSPRWPPEGWSGQALLPQGPHLRPHTAAVSWTHPVESRVRLLVLEVPVRAERGLVGSFRGSAGAWLQAGTCPGPSTGPC